MLITFLLIGMIVLSSTQPTDEQQIPNSKENLAVIGSDGVDELLVRLRRQSPGRKKNNSYVKRRFGRSLEDGGLEDTVNSFVNNERVNERLSTAI